MGLRSCDLILTIMGVNGMRTYLTLIAIVIFTVGAASAQRSDLAGIQWTLTHANGKEVTSALAYFEIEPGSKRFSGSTGCNRMFGTVNFTERKLAFSAIGMTRKMCKLAAGSMPEADFVKALEKAARYSVNGNNLNVFDRRGRTILKFRRLVKLPPVVDPGPQLRLEDKKWVLESIKNRKTFAPIKGVFINFDAAKKTLGGNGGCNVFGGEYTISGSKIDIKDVVSTMRACIEDGSMNTEQEFFDALRKANRFEITESRLRLYRGRELLLTLLGTDK